ncbi:hypothetical protein L198_08057 [Cryptococcus wingfieldii CBS 7118]|uniref:Zn(2)-C6 fungal-type domain-containing protein n=1 Tax=Cryptococcus wingfieldii CBS 7118 TaxID=1295528 RepID=A0A1E3HJD5_9TREE|nr:hypothetical protein L198_08057 [Cryptococcus wingfieldii CBS 7118]ODN76462.1 hypothetical protein L198_08057 [Cryptococcus wingfieldii CBS 7118]
MPVVSSDHVHPSEGAADSPIKKSRRGNRFQPIVSCLECRRMKWKCDRNFPCNNCKKRGLESICPNGQLSGAKSDRQQVVEMQTRIDELERELHLARQALPTSSTNRPHSHPPDIPIPLLPTSAVPSTSTATRISPEGLGDGAKSAGKRADHGQLTLGETPGISRFFGGAGTQYLMHSEGHSSPASATVPSPSLTMLSSFLPGASKQLSLAQIQSYLPDAITTAHLSGIFFEHGCVNYDIIRNDSFEKIYLAISNTSSSSSPISSARTSRGDENNQHLALVLLVLAVGAQMDTSLPPYNEVGEGLYHLGCIALAHDVSSSITLVQAIIIMSRYESNSGRTVAYEAFWPILGLGIRCAQQIGLHRDGKNWALSDDEVELRRRVYWEMYQEDTLQSMSQGRPRGTKESTVDVVFPMLDPDSMTSIFSRFKYRVSLIFARINSLFSDVKSVSFDQVLALDKATRSLESELPPELVFGSNLPAHQATRRIMFVHRSYFARVLRESQAEPLMSPYSFSYVAELESSRIMIDILKSAMAVDPDIAGRYWIFWFHAFMAIHNFSVSVVRSPHSSLAQAALAQIKEGVNLYESVGKGYKAYSDLPIVRQLLTRASDAIASPGTTHRLDAPFPADLLGVGTTLRRAKDQPLPSLSTSTSNTRSLLPDLETFPTTIADAIAYQNSLLPTPADPTLASSLSRPLEASGVAEGSSLGHEENSDWPSWGDGSVVGENEGSLEYDFDAFLASIIGVDPISLAGLVYDE